MAYPSKISLVGEELVFLVFLWNGGLFLLKGARWRGAKAAVPIAHGRASPA